METAKAGETIGRVTAVGGRSSPQWKGCPLPTPRANSQVTGSLSTPWAAKPLEGFGLSHRSSFQSSQPDHCREEHECSSSD